MKIKKWRIDDSQKPVLVSFSIDRKNCREMIESLLNALEDTNKDIVITFTLGDE